MFGFVIDKLTKMEHDVDVKPENFKGGTVSHNHGIVDKMIYQLPCIIILVL